MKISSKFSAANHDQSDRRAVSRYGKRNGSRSYRGAALANTYRRAVRSQERKDCNTLVGETRERDYWECWYCDSCGCLCESDPDETVHLEDVDADVVSALRDESRNWLRAG